ncbi:MAG: VWA domain-containing protein [Elusimicrobia bacterium]|nr:VWA domain-containing protein [Elusimicrobiota bacterium]
MSLETFRLENPWWLLGLVLLLAAAAVSLFGAAGGPPAFKFPDAGALARKAPKSSGWPARRLPTLLKAAVLLLCVAALARPQKVRRELAGMAEGIDIILVLDTSESMRALDFDPFDRITAAKNAARDFISRRTTDRIGLVVFGGEPLLACPPTLDYDALLAFLDDIAPGMTQSRGTAVGDGLAAAAAHLKDSTAKSRVAVLLTDGANNAGIVDPLTAATAAKSLGIKVYAIGTARRGEAMVPVDHPVFGRQLVPIQDELDEDSLTRIAAETGGRYFRAENAKELSEIYSEIDVMEKTALERPETVSYADFHHLLLGPAALLLAMELLLGQTWLMRLP